MRIDFQPGRRAQRLLLMVVVVVVVVAIVVVIVVVFGPGLFARRLRASVFPAHIFRIGQMIVLLVLHPTILEPYLNLPLGQHQRMGDLDPPSPGQVLVEVKLLLQLQHLVPSVSGPLSLHVHRLVRAVR